MTSIIHSTKGAVKIPWCDKVCLVYIDVRTTEMCVLHIVVNDVHTHDKERIIHKIVIIEMLAVMQLEKCIAGITEVNEIHQRFPRVKTGIVVGILQFPAIPCFLVERFRSIITFQ